MKYITRLKAIDQCDGILKTWIGQTIEAISFQSAEQYLINNGLGYLEIVGELIETIDKDDDTVINFENLN